MILPCLILIPLLAGVLAWAAARWNASAARWIALIAVLADFILTLSLWISNSHAGFAAWFAQTDWAWIPQFGIRFHLALDGLSLLLLMLTFFLGMLSVLASWNEITQAVGFFHLNLLWVLAGIAGVFLAVNLFLFYFAWELMLVPMYFLIAIWGHENRVYAAVKFFIFTQLSGLLMLIAILALFFLHHDATGVYTFEYRRSAGHGHVPDRRDVDNARLLRRVRRQTAGGGAAYLAARCAHRGAHGRQCDPGGPVAEDRRLRNAAFRPAAISRMPRMPLLRLPWPWGWPGSSTAP